jgi:hypothetical protein
MITAFPMRLSGKVLIMRTYPAQSEENWIVTLRAAATGSTATIFPETLGLTVCPVVSRTASVVPHQPTMWTSTVPLFDLRLSLIRTPEVALQRPG